MALSKNRAFSRVAAFVETSETARPGASAQMIISDSTGETMIFHPDGTMDQIDENGNITTKTMVSKEESIALSIALG
jgi:hypothetical protein